MNQALDKKVKEDLIKKMSSVLAHRGPDDEGVYLKSNVALAHKRLSIIDLTPAGHQPMSNEDGSIWIVFNGEIYNYLDLRNDLQEKGHTFSSHIYKKSLIDKCFSIRLLIPFNH